MSLEKMLNQNGAALLQPRVDASVKSFETSAIKITTSPASGYVLTSDAKGNGSWSAKTIYPITAVAPITYTSGQIGLAITNNLKLTANQLDTIQDIKTTSSPTFTNPNIGNFLSTTPVASSVATAAFGSTIVPDSVFINSTGYDLLLNITYDVVATGTYHINLAVGLPAILTPYTAVPDNNLTKRWNLSVIVPSTYRFVTSIVGSTSTANIYCISTPL